LKQVNPDLLLDFARLVQKYSSEDWGNLLATLKDDSSLATLIQAAEAMSKPRIRKHIASYAESKGPLTRQPPVTALLQKVRVNEPEKAEMLTKFRTLTVSRQLFESVADLRSFASSCGLKVSNGAEREKIINDLIRTLAALPSGEVKNRLSSLSTRKSNLSEDYERWVRIILGEAKPQLEEGEKRPS